MRMGQGRVPIFVAAWNMALKKDQEGNFRSHIDTAPAVFDTDYMWSLNFAVGNSQNNGKRYPTSQVHEISYAPQMYAPGEQIRCASHLSRTNSVVRTGTSFCKYFKACFCQSTLTFT